MFPFVTYGKTDASTTRRPSSPCTRIVSGSTTDSSSVPIFAAHDANRLDPLAAILVRRQIVEAQRRMPARVGALDLHRAARIGVHRPDVHLVAVLAGG